MSTMISATDVEMRKTISRNIQSLLESQGISVNQFAKLVDEPRNTIYRIVRGENVPGVGVLASMAKALGVTIDEIVSEKIPK